MTSRQELKLPKETLTGSNLPIRPSWKHRIQSASHIIGPISIFAFVCGVAAYLWHSEIHPTHFVGQANQLSALVMSPDDGMISNVWFKLHHDVVEGSVVAEVVTTDPRTVNSRLAVMRGRMALTQLEMSPVLNQQRNSLDYAELSLRAKGLKVEIATDRANQEHAKADVKRQEQLFQGGLISQEVVDLHRQAVRSLETAITEKTALLQDMEKTLEQLSFLAQTFVPGSENDPLKQALRVQEGQTKALEDKIRPLKLLSPIDGTVTAIYHAPGENILAGEPILKITARKPDRIIGELPAGSKTEPRQGIPIRVRTRTQPRQQGIGEIIGFNPALVASTNLSTRSTTTPLYSEISISIPTNLTLRPGQPVDLEILE